MGVVLWVGSIGGMVNGGCGQYFAAYDCRERDGEEVDMTMIRDIVSSFSESGMTLREGMVSMATSYVDCWICSAWKLSYVLSSLWQKEDEADLSTNMLPDRSVWPVQSHED